VCSFIFCRAAAARSWRIFRDATRPLLECAPAKFCIFLVRRGEFILKIYPSNLLFTVGKCRVLLKKRFIIPHNNSWRIFKKSSENYLLTSLAHTQTDFNRIKSHLPLRAHYFFLLI